MLDLNVYPSDITNKSVAELAALPQYQLQEVHHNLAQLSIWLKTAKAKFDAALDHRYGAQMRAALHESGRDFGSAHANDGALKVSFDLPKKVSWDQQKLQVIAQRIAASGERIEDFMDIELSVSESKFNNWPPALREQFSDARTVKAGKPTFKLVITDEGVL